MKNKIKDIVIAILSIIVLAFGCYFIYNKIQKDDTGDNYIIENEESVKNILIKNIKEYGLDALSYEHDDTKFIEFANFLLNYIGFDNTRGALGIYTHGYTT